MPIRCVIFDFDGTLVDSDPVKRMAFYEVTAEVPGAAEVLETIFARPDPGDRYDIFAKLAARLDSDAAGDWAEAYGRLCERRILDLLARSGVGRTLGRLKADGYRLFVASATPQGDLVSLLEKSPLAAIFAGVYGRPRAKSQILHDILHRYAWTPGDVIMVGNGESDRRAAAAVGCPFVGVGCDASAFDGPVSALIADIEGLTQANIVPTIERPPSAAACAPGSGA